MFGKLPFYNGVIPTSTKKQPNNLSFLFILKDKDKIVYIQRRGRNYE